ncbi:1-deoxy-D-xylulose-5-phosphate synthase [Hydromonas duriensis]|uniref:1-deoxy-D-xylulose-5-phosphate synthase n=1 Tax=Hydromonas duriensis TaxID=1527608 RepID=A0A4R6Y0K6_9BURK|nr:1-deoxy-D-xylulose-5-phosphate synthase [Hydromonas duriensis]TDR28835.1 1-deoxy-D-xylulose-5-phosphate synthase [Hydromonas duriensis]
MTNFSLLEQINDTADVRGLSRDQLGQLAQELRGFILESVAQTGGHLSSNLGTVELAVALHHVFNTPEDKIVWDVGHQSYGHKILTGRREQMHTLRQQGGLSGFPKRSESPYDAFGTAHSSTSISAALGMAAAARHLGLSQRQHIAVIGDGALTGGMAFEAMNNAGVTDDINLLVILNDNDMSISPPVGALNRYLARLLSGNLVGGARDKLKKILKSAPPVLEFAKRFEEHTKGMFVPATMFEEFGFNYIGPINGHDLDSLLPTLENLKHRGGVQFLHVITKKGQGYKLAEEDPIMYHGPSKFNPQQGIQPTTAPKSPTFTQVFGQWICDMAEKDWRLVGITPAMREGSGLVEFHERYPSRYFDVGIAEQHAATFAAGLACDGLKPVLAIYSTFLQRAYDQVIHDIALQNLDVTFAIDRAGLVGADGATHAGVYDIAYLRCVPQILIATPSDEAEARALLSTAYQYEGPAAVRYPRGSGIGAVVPTDLDTLPIGKAKVVREGQKAAILVFGTLLHASQLAAEQNNATLVDMRWVKPLDEALLTQLIHTHSHFITVEDSTKVGGAGSAVSEWLSAQGVTKQVLHLGLPDKFIDHGDCAALYALNGLDEQSIASTVSAFVA